ncbi:MAG: ABATE domain-containing protein [Candidatus Solibacter usitatus]|nr:ABATE domain-containing protein [Candidatus Solibacter usitatus]
MAGYSFDFTGGSLCLNFVNTVSNRATSEPIEHLRRYEDWLAWSRQAGMNVKSLERVARRQTQRAQAVLDRALRLRESLYAIFSAIAAQKTPPPQELAALNRVLPAAMAHPKILAAPSGFTLQWQSAEDALDAPLGPIVRSATELLSTAGELAKVRECAASGCAWLFLDTSRNKQRRWCDMTICGNRNKARRYYQKRREA